MACLAATLGVIILSGFIHLLSAANKDTCDLYGAVGQSLTLPLAYEGLTNTHVLRWTHNNTLIFLRQQGKVTIGKTEDVSASGSLLLRNLQFKSAGAYQADVLDSNATLSKTWSGRLCVIEKVPKPQLTYVCDFKSKAVHLTCNVAKPQGLAFSWTLDGKTLTSETKQTLSISLEQLKGERSFTCAVANKASMERSETVRPACKSPPPSPPPPPLVCLTRKTVVAAAAGGVSVILLMLIIIIVLCCCLRRNKSKLRVKEKGELRMLSLTKREPDSSGPVYETMHPGEDSPSPCPKASERACYQSVSEPEAQIGNRPLQLPTAAEEREPSPVPKPRTKGPQTVNS